MPSMVDHVLTYQFIKRFVMPYEEWPAFKTGVIDNKGNIVKKRKDLSNDEDKSFGNYDRLILNLRKLLAKLPGGNSRLGVWAATALLLKEGETLDPDDVDILSEKLDSELLKVEHVNLSNTFSHLYEDAGAVPGNAVGGGHIAGTKEAGDDPPVRKKAHKAHIRKNKKFSAMPFARRSGAK